MAQRKFVAKAAARMRRRFVSLFSVVMLVCGIGTIHITRVQCFTASLSAKFHRHRQERQHPQVAEHQPGVVHSPTTLLARPQVPKEEETVLPMDRQWTLDSIGECWGSGSYGTVHALTVTDGISTISVVGKRAWTLMELQAHQEAEAATIGKNDKIESKEQDIPQSKESIDHLKDKATRCRYYISVEQHCLDKLTIAAATGDDNIEKTGVTEYMGTTRDDEQRLWLLFASSGAVDGGKDDTPVVISLDRLMEEDNKSNKNQKQKGEGDTSALLEHTGRALGIIQQQQHDNEAGSIFLQTLDTITTHLLETISFVHAHSIVHRDIKPSNLLVDTTSNRLILIDFGSAADVSTAGMFQENIGLGSRVAISPIYAAPEIFVDVSNDRAVTFDCFSVGLLISQFLFSYLEDRKESGFHQQLEDAGWDLDTWLQNVLQSKVRPNHLDDALAVLRQRPGLWKLLQELLVADPRERISSSRALVRWKDILQTAKTGGEVENSCPDGAYLQEVLDTLDQCMIPPDASDTASPTRIQPLHFVASFRRRESLGLVLAEYDADTDEMTAEDREEWDQAISQAEPGQVFVKGIVPGGQAETMGIFHVGDRLHGIGELPFEDGGFERAVEMLQDQPRSTKFVTLHFDRTTMLDMENDDGIATSAFDASSAVTIVSDQGAWSIKGKRKGQEDAFLLHVVNDTKDRSILLLGVLDGHLGASASNFVRDNLPICLSSAITVGGTSETLESLLEKAWQECCDAYRLSCVSETECVAEYDPREGTLLAYTGSEDAVAGTTAAIFAFEQGTNSLATLNCGDSRGLVLDPNGKVIFKSKDHTPENEMNRLMQQKELGFPVSIPECVVNKWVLAVGDYDYAVARSLEGSFATSKGIVSDADIHKVHLDPGATLIVATDGLFEVVDSVEACRFASELRAKGSRAGDVAKSLVSLAFGRGSFDNISAVVVYME